MRLWIGANEIELTESGSIAQTKQVNNIATLGNRQSNYTNTISAKKTPRNKITFDNLGDVGSVSRVPYTRASCNLLDDETGDWLIYGGWATVTETAMDYKIYVYDGIIDFYKAIENKSLTNVGVPDLNHVKNLATVVASFDNLLPYVYVLADYNGKFLTTDFLNIDYLVPSAKISYIWDRIHLYAGFTYSGSVFATERFVNLLMTYPKPVPTEVPIVNLVTSQDSAITLTPAEFPYGNGTFYGWTQVARIFPVNFDTADANNNSGYTTIETTGTYRLKVEGVLTRPTTTGTLTNGNVHVVTTTTGSVTTFDDYIDGAVSQVVLLPMTAGDKLFLSAQLSGSSSPAGTFPLEGTIKTTLDYVVGYDANFDLALVDFSAKEFYDDILQRFALTAFKDPFTNHIEYLTLDEIVQNTGVLDWSNKHPRKITEKYKVGSYAQLNKFTYRYNSENETHNDGSISIDDKNLPDEKTVVSSPFYSPEKLKTLNFMYFDYDTHVYKLWNKEVDDEGVVKYKELSGRFYLLRAETRHYGGEGVTLKSEALNVTTTTEYALVESYYRLPFHDILLDNYKSIDNILNDAKVVDMELFLTSRDVATFDFKRLIYLEQFAAYYIVNKINAFIPGKPTKCELVKVDYVKEVQIPEIIQGTFISIKGFTIDGCSVTLYFETDQPMPSTIYVNASKELFGGVPNPLTDSFSGSFTVAAAPQPYSVTFSLPSGGFWNIVMQLTGLGPNSSILNINNFATCTVTPPPSDLTYITITKIETLSVSGNFRDIKITFETDWNYSGTLMMNKTEDTFSGFGSVSFLGLGVPFTTILHTTTDNAFGNHITWHFRLSVGTVQSNIVDN